MPPQRATACIQGSPRAGPWTGTVAVNPTPALGCEEEAGSQRGRRAWPRWCGARAGQVRARPDTARAECRSWPQQAERRARAGTDAGIPPGAPGTPSGRGGPRTSHPVHGASSPPSAGSRLDTRLSLPSKALQTETDLGLCRGLAILAASRASENLLIAVFGFSLEDCRSRGLDRGLG